MEDRVYKGVPAMETERLIIRPILQEDSELILKHMNNSEVRKFFDKSWPKDREGVEKFVREAVEKNENDKAAEWVLVSKKSANVIGRIWFGALLIWCNGVNVGYSLDYDYWGQGIMSEGLKKVVEFGFDQMHLRRIEAWHDTNNPASGKVMLKCGFIYEGTLRERSSFGNAEMYSIIQKDYYSGKHC